MADGDTLGPAAARHSLTGSPEAAQDRLGYRFKRPELLREALTHRSAAQGRGRKRGHGSNERLEFVGDRVLGLLMAEWLVEKFPREPEGKLGPRLANLVSREVLAEIAVEIGWSATLSIAPNEREAGVGRLATVLADALEAALGAMYLDGGLEPARGFLRRAWGSRIEAQIVPPKDPKTALQEWALARGTELPTYATVSMEGPSHAPNFVISVSTAGKSGTGTAGSKRMAERAAAAALLAQL